MLSSTIIGNPQGRVFRNTQEQEEEVSCPQMEVLRGRDGRDGRDGECGLFTVYRIFCNIEYFVLFNVRISG